MFRINIFNAEQLTRFSRDIHIDDILKSNLPVVMALSQFFTENINVTEFYTL